MTVRRRFQKMPMVKEMLEMGKELPDPGDWEKRRVRVMEVVLRDRF